MAPIRVLAIIEARTVTGPAKNLIEFARSGHRLDPGVRTHEVCIATFQRGRSDANAFLDAADLAEITSYRILERGRFDLGIVRRLGDIVEEVKPSIIQTHNVKSHLVMRLSRLQHLYPWVAFHHGYTSTDVKDRLYNQCNRWSLRAADHVVTVCQKFASDMHRIGVLPHQLSVQHNMAMPFTPASATKVSEIRNALHCRPPASLLISVGRLSKEKGHSDLLHAVSLLARRKPTLEVVTVFLGEGPERRRLIEQSRQLGIADKVVFAGHTEDLQSYYSAADLAILPSHSEGSSNAVLEAMAAGIPIVATRAGGTAEILTDGKDALLVPVKDPVSLATAIVRLIGDRNLAATLAKSASTTINSYTPERYGRSLLTVYRKVLSARVARATLCSQ